MSGGEFTVGQPFSPYKLFKGIFIPEAICKYRGLTAGAKMALGRLFRYAGRDGKAYPSVPTLGPEIGISSKQARRYVRELENGRFVRCEREAGKTSHYVFLWHTAYTGDVGASRKGGRPRPAVGVPEDGSAVPPENGTPVNGRRRESDSLRESGKESQSKATKADNQPTNCKKRNSSAVSGSIAEKRKSKEPAFRGDWMEEDLEAVEDFLAEHEPDDTEDHGNGEWAAEATLNAGMGAEAEDVLSFLEALVETGWTAPNYRAFPAVVHHEFVRRRNRANGTCWSTEKLAMLRAALKHWMEGEEPPARFEESCELRANGATARQVFDLLNRRWSDAKYRPGGKHAPRKWSWFLKVIGNEFSVTERGHLPEQPASAVHRGATEF